MTNISKAGLALRILVGPFGRLYFKRTGWKVEGELPDLPKCVVTVAPHTTNWDFWMTLCVFSTLEVHPAWVGKKSLFRPPVGWLLRWLGGIPIDRSARHNTVQQLVDRFEHSRQLILLIPPEGTRKKANGWKTGFYHIALGAKVPIVMGFVDYQRKVAGFGPTLVPGGDIDADMERFRAFYATVHPKYPENASEVKVGIHESAAQEPETVNPQRRNDAQSRPVLPVNHPGA